MNKLEKLMQPGDLLAYRASGIFGWMIGKKTWHDISHVEIYVGDGNSIASRDGLGVGYYPLRTSGLAGIYRPNWKINFEAGKKYFNMVNGQKYNWPGIMAFGLSFVKGRSKGKMFCSEFATSWFRATGGEPFSATESAEKVVPFQLTISPALPCYWRKGRGVIVHPPLS